MDQDQLQSNGMVDNETVLTDCAIGNDTVKTDCVRAYSASISTQTDQPSPHGQRSRSTSGSYTTVKVICTTSIRSCYLITEVMYYFYSLLFYLHRVHQ